MVTAFAAGGVVDLVPALAVMLGANVGTTLIVQALSFDVSRVSFLLILIGVMMFRRSAVTRTRDLGRVGIGLGLVLIALQHLLAMITPYEDAPSLRMLLGAITTDPPIDILLAAGLTWAAHSSVAIVLLIMTFAAQGIVPPHAAFALVLGANLGTAINPLIESGVGGDPAAKRPPIGKPNQSHCRVRAGARRVELDRPQTRHDRTRSRPRGGRLSHGVQHRVGAAVFPVLRPFAKLLMRMLPGRVDPADPSRPMYLDGAARETPSIALAGAAREALRMSDVFETMLAGALDSLDRGDRKRVTETKRMDDVLDRLDREIKEYITSLDIDALSDAEHRRLSEIVAFTTNIEHAGDILEKSLMPLAAKRIKRGLAFSDANRDEIRYMIERLIGNACRRGSVHDRGSRSGPTAAWREGGLPRHRNQRHADSFRCRTRGTIGKR